MPDSQIPLVCLKAIPFRPDAGAAVFWGRIFMERGQAPTPALIAHELKHIDQGRKMGWFWWTIVYSWLYLKHGYDNHPMEVEAELASEQQHMLERANKFIVSHQKELSECRKKL